MRLTILGYLILYCRQLFILYDALAEPSLKAMNSIVGSAVNMCTVAYLLVRYCVILNYLLKIYSIFHRIYPRDN